MGRYFGLLNQTRNERVSHYWKDYIFCDLYSVMHRYGWNKDDEIISAAYDSCYIWNGKDFIDVEDEPRHCDEECSDQPRHCDEEEPMEKKIDIPEVKLGFASIYEDWESGKFNKNYFDHIPDWDEKGKCKHCQHCFDENVKKEDVNEFNSVFHMN